MTEQYELIQNKIASEIALISELIRIAIFCQKTRLKPRKEQQKELQQALTMLAKAQKNNNPRSEYAEIVNTLSGLIMASHLKTPPPLKKFWLKHTEN